ncbi:MAG: FAD-dependent oxidoreductase [Firmicutes bacterium]|nr:FAD-dependent oxidoreductase [Bacillota bacterium]
MDILIIGSGFAGIEASFLLSELPGLDADITVVSLDNEMVFTPSLIWLPPKRKLLGDISFDLKPIFNRKGINFYIGEVVSVEPQDNKVVLASGLELGYDYLIVSAGWKPKRSHVRGHKNVLFPCALRDVLELTRIIDEMDGGTITFAIEGERPGPGAEYLGWIHVYLSEKGIRDRFDLHLAEEKHRLLIHLGREACDLLTEDFRRCGVTLHLGRKLAEARPGIAVLEDGLEIPSDVICSVGKVEAPDFLQKLKFSTAEGFMPVNEDLSCKSYDNIFVAGDAADFGRVNVPKVAHVALEQGQVAARNVYAAITGSKKQKYDAEHAFANFYILSDFGVTAVLAKNYKIIDYGEHLSSLKEAIERYYIYTHKAGIPWKLI